MGFGRFYTCYALISLTKQIYYNIFMQSSFQELIFKEVKAMKADVSGKTGVAFI